MEMHRINEILRLTADDKQSHAARMIAIRKEAEFFLQENDPARQPSQAAAAQPKPAPEKAEKKAEPAAEPKYVSGAEVNAAMKQTAGKPIQGDSQAKPAAGHAKV